MKEEVDALLAALADSGCSGARARMPALLAAVHAPIDEPLARTALDALRSWRCFAAMQTFAAELAQVGEGRFLIHVTRQLAQARIELGLLDGAAALLERLVQDLNAGSGREWSEVNGLLGRVHKQRFVLAAEGGARGERELRDAVAAYIRAFDQNPAWHGANIVALLARAERDGIAVDTGSAQTWARRLLDALAEKARAEWSAWDYASAGEAYLALGDHDNVADCFARYWNAPNLDAFALAGTERQLKEIWQIARDSPDPFESSLLLHLEARRLTAASGEGSYSAADLKILATQLRDAAGRAEATFGAGSAIPLQRVLGLLDRARSVCRIIDPYDPGRSGTGFLVNGRQFVPGLEGTFILTNHHVLHGDEASEALLAEEAYLGSIHVRRAVAEFHYWGGEVVPRKVKILDVVRHSPRPAADFALASLSEPVPENLALPLSTVAKPLGSRNIVDPRQRCKVVVIGHPGGWDLSFSLSDNEVVDHELDDSPCPGPRRIHYRTPTQPGSSGSPVFHDTTLEVVGLHRSGSVKPLREDWPRARNDEPYKANEAVAVRSVLGI